MNQAESPKKRRIGFFSSQDMYWESDPKRFSLILVILIGVVWVLRRLSFYERIKSWIFRESPTPAWFLDGYLISLWGLIAVIAYYFDSDNQLPTYIKWLYFFCIFQIVQTNIYHELWRPELLHMQNVPLEVSWSRLRNLIIAICNFVFVTCLFGLIYWKSNSLFGQDPLPFNGIADAIYFSFTIAATCGSESIPSAKLDNSVQGTIITQIVVGLFLITIVLSTCVAAIRTTKDQSRTTTPASSD